jgi:predicted RNA-binding protein with PUA-like domain
MNYWLLKQEPTGYNLDSLEKEKKLSGTESTTIWP